MTKENLIYAYKNFINSGQTALAEKILAENAARKRPYDLSELKPASKKPKAKSEEKKDGKKSKG